MADTTLSPTPAKTIYNRQNPFLAELTAHVRLTGEGSAKDTRHFVIALADSGLTYTPGDSLGTYGRNPPDLVDELMARLGFDSATPVLTSSGRSRLLREALVEDYTVNRANRKIITGLLKRAEHPPEQERLTAVLQSEDSLRDYIDTRDYVDLLKEYPSVRFASPEDFIAQLTPNAPRLYSIASSMAAHPGEVHLCIGVVRYETHGRTKKGLASGFFADHAQTFVKNIPVYVQEARSFHLPADPSRDIIMVGPGTGVAPFRAFLEQRMLDGATGRNWLFFGEQHRSTDFLYGPEFLEWQKRGSLHKLSLAFSRDQPHRIYVQHRMLEEAATLWEWLQGGAYFYVCGDARHMAKDVHQTLIRIACEQGGMDLDKATEYASVTLPKTEKRYLKDVY